MKKQGKLYLLPTPLGFKSSIDNIPTRIIAVINIVDVILSEKPKKTRAFLKRIETKRPIQAFTIHTLNLHTQSRQLLSFLQMLKSGLSVGIVSEAGCPAVADPGSKLVALAHENDIDVVPLVGPSSILLALMASGLNGQNFAFVGYLPKKASERIKRIKALSNIVRSNNQTQIMIETPYRNEYLFQDLIKNLSGKLDLCIAVDLTTPDEYIKTKQVRNWRQMKKLPKLKNRQVVFLLGLRSYSGASS